MTDYQGIRSLLLRLWAKIPTRRRRQFAVLLLLMVLASFAEIISIGAVLPFLGMLTAPEQVYAYPAMQPVIAYLGITEPRQLLWPATVAFASAALGAGAMRLGLLWASTRLAFSTGADLSHEIYRRTLYQPYEVHLSRNSSQVIAAVSMKVREVIDGVIFPVILIFSATVMLVTVLAALAVINFYAAAVIFAGLGGIYVLVMRLTRHRLLANSELVARESANVIKTLQEGLGGIRDVLLDQSQEVYCEVYKAADIRLRTAQGNNEFLRGFPRFGVEALGMILIAVIAYKMTSDSAGISTAIPILGALALGAQRLFPILQQTYGNWAAIRASQASLQYALELLEQPLVLHTTSPVNRAISFAYSVELRSVSFRYRNEAGWVLRELDLQIARGARVGFFGVTGSGKSTLLDLLMGLLRPERGQIVVDGVPLEDGNLRQWQARIAHVPQAIFLADASIAENIAFGVPRDQIDMLRVQQAARQAQIADTIASWPEGYETSVGERGVRLSGGQRQRIGIARALYKQADVIVFDEATSALDTETEQAVMKAIDALSPDLTILVIAHRLSTLRNCTQIVELRPGQAARVGTVAEMIDRAPSHSSQV